MSKTEEILSQLPGDVLGGLRKVDGLWSSLRSGKIPVSSVVTVADREGSSPHQPLDTDVVICGGTLGIMMACALQLRGIQVTVVERGILRGRIQEWNISRRELGVLVELGLLTPEQLEEAIATEYNPARVSFPGGDDIWVNDILNIGIDPVFLLESLKQRFLAAGGTLLEQTPFQGATIYPDRVMVKVGDRYLNARLLLDAMGHFSPMSQQARAGAKPDAVCLVVGSVAQGYPKNDTGDLFVSFTLPINHCQYFWEAFPAKDGRTTYLFTYLDAHPDRFSLEFFYEEYLRLLPEYQNISLDKLTFQRALFGFFPCYQNSPLKLPFDRILPIGDSSGSQSPLSFGGFGAMIRHLKRLTLGIEEALTLDTLKQKELALLQPYQPSLSVTWLFQRSMSLKMESKDFLVPPNDLLSGVFAIMEEAGDEVLYPFLQDVVQFPGLTQTLLKTWIKQPISVLKIIPQVGLSTLFNWTLHYQNLASYTFLDLVGKSLERYLKFLSPEQLYTYHRWLDSWHYGSGRDYHS
ncbi:MULTISPECIES: FAD-binding oxidoreductase [unclassified Roseofilum]|uniref:NAD(P)/FAD-dependent oxidoreductase n=1 Tax=unclassified Roseofilum TaxID=2620099 RepID=UPI000E8BA803|nr:MULTISPECIES: FAD-binding oxidoreductase [unclassified Roseofilum]HBQ97639.1 FAD-dependent oxidoreductase [Cyanobacteria bacterium UBA11691]MBP0008234.1 FAD-binding oxidoreductase [Roseofilum sp. Belize Diploria]MBP0015464.1 FAD-binding oxidoreductase [Roseofilum sp. SID3]MBP0023218.1 FAD-binding oxidoreductase [Roseofilum sp. SID2]MBP0039890.1 FAD-binding oxidoreductase [Roseofilum sp. SID1]